MSADQPTEGMVILVGYHGTEEGNYNSIKENGLKESAEEGSWLGKGVYFFESKDDYADGKQEAFDWARFCKKAEKCLVIEANISVPQDQCLDLCNLKTRRFFNQIIKEAKRKKCKDRFSYLTIFNYLEEVFPDKFKVIRVYAYGTKIEDPIINIVLRPQIQTCVKDTKMIEIAKYHFNQ